MQLEIYKPTGEQYLPHVEWNFIELKTWLEDGLAAYKGRVYTEDTIKDAKRDVANLRKLSAAIDGKRKEIKALYLQPYEMFEAQAKELTGMIGEQVSEIAAQIDAFDAARKAEKQAHIKAVYAGIMADLLDIVPYDKIHNDKWLNVTVTMAAIEAELVEKAESIRAALASIDALGLPDDIAGRVKAVYLDKLDLAAALAEKDKIETQKQMLAAYEAAKKASAGRAESPQETVPEMQPAPAPADDEIHVIDFRIWATKQQLGELRAFLVEHGIKYGKVR